MRIAPLSEIATAFDSGFACGKDKLTADGLPHLRPFNIGDSLQVELETLYRVPHAEAPKGRTRLVDGDILFNNTNSIELVGKVAIVSEEMNAGYSNHITRIRIKRAEAEPRYVAAYLNHLWRKRYFEGRATRWVSQAAFNGEALKALPIPLPPLEDQRRIAAVLDRSARLVKLHREAAAKTRDLIPALFIDMFGDPATNPMGWEVVPLNRLGTFERGKSKHRPRNDPKLFGGDYPFVQTGDVANADFYLRQWSETYSDIGLAQSRLWPRGTLCVTIAANIGKTAILDFDACFPDSVVGFVPQDGWPAVFVKSFLDFAQKDLEAFAPQAAQKNINLKILDELVIPTPPVARAMRFSQLVSQLLDALAEQTVAIDHAEELHRSLLAEVFGEA